jgi:hypothetical protein
MKLSREEYDNVQSQLTTLAALVRLMPLGDFIEQLEHADTVGPMLDPTGWRAAREHLEMLKRMAIALHGFQRVLPTLEEALAMDERRDKLLELAGRERERK